MKAKADIGGTTAATPFPAPIRYQDTWDSLMQVPLSQLCESPMNPRKRFDPVKLEELAASIRQSGILTPLCVRPMPINGEGPMFEIGAGARRFRASKLADLTVVPAVIRQLDDQAFLELLMFENPNHGDLHPLEEAAGYRTLMEKAGYDVPRIAERMGRSPRFIYDSLTLLNLTPKAKELFLAGAFERGHAIELARLTPAQQQEILQLEPDDFRGVRGGLWQDERIERDPHADDQEDLAQEDLPLDEPVKPVSVRELKHYINEHVRATPATIDPFLFPETAAQLQAAAAAKKKVIHITYDYRVPDAARDEKVRTYGSEAWQRADGQFKSKPCDHAVLGLVVAGPCRGEAFPVCIAKEKCHTHWAEWQKARERRQAELAKETKGSGRPKASDPMPAKKEKPEPSLEQRQTLAVAVVKDLLPTWLPGIREFAGAFKKLPDLLLWNLAVGGDDRPFTRKWAAKLGSMPGFAGYTDTQDLLDELLPQLPGQWRGADPKDATATSYYLGALAWLARSDSKAAETVEKEIVKRFDAQMELAASKLAAESRAEYAKAKKAPTSKPAAKKAAKPKGKKR